MPGIEVTMPRADDSLLDAKQRLRVIAALGGAVRLAGPDLRALIAVHGQVRDELAEAKEARREARLQLDRASAWMFWAAVTFGLSTVNFLLAWLS